MDNISSDPFVPPDEPPVHYIRLCLLAPCTVNISTCWFIGYTVWLLMLIIWSGFFLLTRIYPSYARIRRTYLLFYAIGIGAKPPLLNRRELLVLVLYGLAFTSVLNLLEAQLMAFVTVTYQERCYKTVPELYDSQLRVKQRPIVLTVLAAELDPILQERIVLDNYTRVDLTTKRFAYLLGCEAARALSKTAANYNPEWDLFRMAVIEEPVASVGIPIVEEYTPETGIVLREINKKATQFYDKRYSPGKGNHQRGDYLKIIIYFTLLHTVSIGVFCLEMISKLDQRKMVDRALKMIRSMQAIKRACELGRNKKIHPIKIVEAVNN